MKPDWLEILAAECERTSQKRVSTLIGYSSSVVSQVLKGIYPGNLEAVEKAVRGAFLNMTVECPVCGTLAANLCLEYQRLPFAATNPQRVRLYRACRSGCSHSRLEESK